MLPRFRTATRLGFREQWRRPLLLLLLVVVPFLFITWSFYITEATPHRITLPGGELLATDMREVHGAIMVPITVGFLAGLVGLFVVRSALDADRRLVVAGFSPGEAIAPRLVVLGAATLLILAVSLAVMAINFTPVSWVQFVGGNLLAGLIYAAIGALAGAFMGRLGAAYFMFFLPMTDFGVAQNPMFFSGDPQQWATFLPGYGPTRVIVGGAYGSGFEAGGELVLGLLWAAAFGLAVVLLLRRSVAQASLA